MNLEESSVQDRLAYGSFLSLSNRYLYIEVPKAACTTIKKILWDAEGLPIPDGEQDPNSYVHRRCRYDGRLSLVDLSVQAQRNVLHSTEWFKFVFVRNPYSRLVSGFINKIASGDTEFVDIRTNIKDAYGAGFGSSHISFEMFVRYICNQKNVDRNIHWKTQSALVFFNDINFDFVGKIESFKIDFQFITSKVPQLNLSSDLESRINNSSTQDWREYYNDELAELVFNSYEEDFANFGYDFFSYRPV